MLILPFVVYGFVILSGPSPLVLSSMDERSFLDGFLGPFRSFRLRAKQGLTRELDRKASSRILRANNKVQPQIPQNVPFPCKTENTRSVARPSSVHKLRPGDIDVVGAIGDSLTAGFGLRATTPLETLSEERGKSFSIGGEGTWRTYLTLPNILKEFNPNLVGYSLGPSLTIERASQFNVAEGGAISQNTPYMTKVLIKRIKSDRRVNLRKDWKMITYLIGDNDFCSEICYKSNYEEVLERHRQDLLDVLRLLRDNLPRTIVNFIPPLHLSLLVQMNAKSPFCELVHPALCPCLIGLPHRYKREALYKVMRRWQEIDMDVANLPEFDLDTFTVVAQPYTMDYSVPQTSGGKTDQTYFSEDCFHISQKGTAQWANDLWNNLMEPVGQKTRNATDLFKQFNCPTEEKPYIFTRRNS